MYLLGSLRALTSPINRLGLPNMGFYGAWIIRAFYAGLNVCVTESSINAL
ncbi:hypothetical protein THF1C08_160113 [Vibrio jasicida]|uniref:DUF3265 domain-containing protein n=1 Tax=Vibrio jasicida TaxID=766224 RepID=A0AAU9QH79_9VIBR|nr:hypothetical protein THF1C08_160113 [Vibrio jasicida]CAH1577235.1 hypothetical protein THF1A12_140113 [Vibrio jasicida]